MSLKVKLSKSNVKRGDTIIEAMFAFAVFSMVSIITVSMMNLGVAASERSLELTTVRNELNAQAEALRFIHSSYIAQQNLPARCDEDGASVTNNRNCQHYHELWNAIVSRTLDASADRTIDYPLSSCHDMYDNNLKKLSDNKAFVINTRQLSSYSGIVIPSNALVYAEQQLPGGQPNNYIFTEPTLSARIIYGSSVGNSSDQLSNLASLTSHINIKKVEGIWVIGVKGPTTGGGAPQYYDFYIETCWYGSNNATPTSLDTVVRLYNPEGV